MRTISCFSVTMYFSYIEKQIKKGKVFALEGLKCFEKILKTNKFQEIFAYLAKVMTNLLSDISVTDSIMELIVISNYEAMVQKS